MLWRWRTYCIALGRVRYGFALHHIHLGIIELSAVKLNVHVEKDHGEGGCSLVLLRLSLLPTPLHHSVGQQVAQQVPSDLLES
jgi:hypothetical protein